MKSTKYLDQLIAKKNLKNDAALAQYLSLGKSNISQYRSGTRIMDNETCLKVAMALEIDPIEIIMAADIDRATRAGQRSLWEVFTQRGALAKAASLLLGCALSVNLFLTPDTANAASSRENSERILSSILPATDYAKYRHQANESVSSCSARQVFISA